MLSSPGPILLTPSFRFQFRAIDKGLESLITVTRPDVALSLIAEMGFCTGPVLWSKSSRVVR